MQDEYIIIGNIYAPNTTEITFINKTTEYVKKYT